MDKQELKEKYKEDFSKIRMLVNEFDPCGLIALSAPEDEYDCLSNKIMSSYYSGKSRDEIKEIILHEIAHHFGTDLKFFEVRNREEFYLRLDQLLEKIKP